MFFVFQMEHVPVVLFKDFGDPLIVFNMEVSKWRS